MHFQLIAELERLFPEGAPLWNLEVLPAGFESIETVSVRLLRSFERTLEPQIYFVFTRLNAERLEDAIADRLFEDGWPLDTNEIVAETYARLYRSILAAARRGEPVEGGESEVWSLLLDGAEQVIEEQVAQLEFETLPLPGMPMPDCQLGAEIEQRCERLLDGEGVELDEREARRWALHAFVRLEPIERQVLLLRSVDGLDFTAVAERMRRTAFEVAGIARRAEQRLAENVDLLVDAFLRGGPVPPDARSKRPPPEDLDVEREGQEDTDE